MGERNGTDVDAAYAKETFSKLGYKTKVFNDLTVNQMTKLLSDGNANYTFSFSQSFKVYSTCRIQFSYLIIKC